MQDNIHDAEGLSFKGMYVTLTRMLIWLALLMASSAHYMYFCTSYLFTLIYRMACIWSLAEGVRQAHTTRNEPPCKELSVFSSGKVRLFGVYCRSLCVLRLLPW